MDKDKRGSARMGEDPSSCSLVYISLSTNSCADFEQRAFYSQMHHLEPLCRHRCLALSEAHVCMCKFFQMLASQVLTSREGASESENVS